MQSIAALLGKHLGEEAWIFGKGPSLDKFDMATAGPLRICINESALIVPEPRYFFGHDEPPIQRVAAQWPSACRAILQPVRARYDATRGIPTESIFTYEKREREVDVLDWSPEKIAREACLLGLTGTVHSALHFCRLIGVTVITFVGMDGGGGYALSIGHSAPPGGGQHDVIRRDSITIAKRLNLEYRFINPD